MIVSLIVAAAENGVIGRDGDLPWRLPDDLKRFKALTTGHALLMGRKTWESLGGRPLPKRRHLVLTRQPDYAAPGIEVVRSVDHALALLGNSEPELFVIGGAQIYQLCLPIAHRLYLTRVHAHVDGDTRFPHVDLTQWHEVDRDEHPADDRHPYPFTHLTYERC